MQDAVRTRVKICGLTRQEDVQAAVQAGADAVGFVFYADSKRAVSLEQARALRRHLPAFVSAVALFVNADPDYVKAIIKHVQPDVLQFHGDETPESCSAFGHPYMRAFRIGGQGMETPQQVCRSAMAYLDASAWLF